MPCTCSLDKRLHRLMSSLIRAADGIRTRDLVLGKHVRYHCATTACIS
jgi:hypothetical protein